MSNDPSKPEDPDLVCDMCPSTSPHGMPGDACDDCDHGVYREPNAIDDPRL